ncbi:MAG: TerB family tellurite resistance protein [Rhodospirillales bacterium]|nr:TerB family tellurite resistance protein [Rhodospirillales bacterium]
MSIWGKVIGGVAGFAVGGPLGAILGVAAGHAIDRAKIQPPEGAGFDSDTRQIAFTTAVIVLCAKMAKADGQVTPDEIAAFRKMFQIPPDEVKKVGDLFNEAKKEATGFEPYAAQVGRLFAHEPAVLEELIAALFVIAKADGHVHPGEIAFVEQVATIFGFSPHQFERLKSIHLGGSDEIDPYEVLGIDKSATAQEIKSTYRKLTRENHPDTLMAQGVPQEFIDLATEKMATINAAYDKVAKQRGIK